jgi:AAA+ ATPase superfamily predicted ATPase
MSKFSNLYDIDGNIINKAPQHNFTLEETEKLVDDLTKKVQENPDNEVYKVYLSNAQKWLYKLYNEMSREDLMKCLNLVKDSIQDAKTEVNEAEQSKIEEINKAVEELKNEYDKVISMDEYVEPIEETDGTK